MEIRYTVNEFMELFVRLCQKPNARLRLDKVLRESDEIGMIFYNKDKSLDNEDETVTDIGIYIP